MSRKMKRLMMNNKLKSLENIKQYVTSLQKAEAEVKRLRRIILVNNLWQMPPCCLCGYNGNGYYDSRHHGCVLEAAEIAEAREIKENKK